jgi:hypothetical protein
LLIRLDLCFHFFLFSHLFRFEEFGIPNVHLESYPIMLTYPIEREVRLVYPQPGYNCVLQEAVPHFHSSSFPSSDLLIVPSDLVVSNSIYQRIMWTTLLLIFLIRFFFECD